MVFASRADLPRSFVFTLRGLGPERTAESWCPSPRMRRMRRHVDFANAGAAGHDQHLGFRVSDRGNLAGRRARPIASWTHGVALVRIDQARQRDTAASAFPRWCVPPMQGPKYIGVSPTGGDFNFSSNSSSSGVDEFAELRAAFGKRYQLFCRQAAMSSSMASAMKTPARTRTRFLC